KGRPYGPAALALLSQGLAADPWIHRHPNPHHPPHGRVPHRAPLGEQRSRDSRLSEGCADQNRWKIMGESPYRVRASNSLSPRVMGLIPQGVRPSVDRGGASRAIEPRNSSSRRPTLSLDAEGNMSHGAMRVVGHSDAVQDPVRVPTFSTRESGDPTTDQAGWLAGSVGRTGRVRPQ